MSRPVLIQVEMSGGKPDLGIPSRFIRRTGPGIFTVRRGEHSLTLKRVGRISGDLVWLGTGSRKIMAHLAHLGANIQRFRDIPGARRTALIARGIKTIRRVSDDSIAGLLPPVVMCGEDPLNVGLDGLSEDEDFYIA